jgi:hypothetical protein
LKLQTKRGALWRLRVILTVLGMMLGMMVAVVTGSASAAPGNILPPFDVGQQWTICRGYGYASHTGTSTYGLDLTGSGCDNSASGRTVRTPVGGTVAYYQSSYGNLCINKPGGGSYTLTHIDSSITGGTVGAGQAVGTVAPPNTRGNNGVSHIHFQMWALNNCYADSGIPFDSAHGAQICGAPDLTLSGPNGYNNGTWSGTSFTGAGCGTGSVNQRIGVMGNGMLDVKEGPIGAGWTTVGGGSSFKLSPNRIALYDGQLSIKEGSLGATWTTVTGTVDEYEVTDNRIAIRIGTQIFIKDGSVGAPWVHVADGVSFEISPNRLAVYNGSALNVKDGNIYGGWTTVTGAVDTYQVTDNRVGILVGGQLSVKDGPLGATWTLVGGGSSFDLT